MGDDSIDEWFFFWSGRVHALLDGEFAELLKMLVFPLKVEWMIEPFSAWCFPEVRRIYCPPPAFAGGATAM